MARPGQPVISPAWAALELTGAGRREKKGRNPDAGPKVGAGARVYGHLPVGVRRAAGGWRRKGKRRKAGRGRGICGGVSASSSPTQRPRRLRRRPLVIQPCLVPQCHTGSPRSALGADEPPSSVVTDKVALQTRFVPRFVDADTSRRVAEDLVVLDPASAVGDMKAESQPVTDDVAPHHRFPGIED